MQTVLKTHLSSKDDYFERLDSFMCTESSLELRRHYLQKTLQEFNEIYDYYDNYLIFCSIGDDNTAFDLKCKLYGLYKFKNETIFYQRLKDRALAGDHRFLEHYGYHDKEILKLVYDNCKDLITRWRVAKGLNICVDSEIFQLDSTAPFKKLVEIFPENVTYIRFALENDSNHSNQNYYFEYLKDASDEQDFYTYCYKYMLRPAEHIFSFKKIIEKCPRNIVNIRLALERDFNYLNHYYYFECLKRASDEQDFYTYCNEYMLRDDVPFPIKIRIFIENMFFESWDGYISNYIINNTTDANYHENVYTIFKTAPNTRATRYKKQYLPFTNDKVRILSDLYYEDTRVRNAINNREFLDLTAFQYEEILINNGVQRKRDPAKYFNDAQNVHNRHINESMKANILLIMKMSPKLESMVPVTNLNKRIFSDSHSLSGITLADIYLRVLKYIDESDHKQELYKRVDEELSDAQSVCWTGVMSRLVNILCGFHPAINVRVEKTYHDIINTRLQNIIPDHLFSEIGSGKLKSLIVPHLKILMEGFEHDNKDVDQYIKSLY